MHTLPFFIYGSLSEGMVHFDKVKEFILERQPAGMRGRAYRLPVGYPVISREGFDWIPGMVVKLKMTDLLQQLLDEFHCCDRVRPEESLHHCVEVEAELQSGERITAMAYVIDPDRLPAEAKLIEGGNWQEALERKPPLTEQLSEKQRTYIIKLRNCRGREIVPIDLQLYRELMGLELIVDKGRRLALSKLGKEVSRYLP